MKKENPRIEVKPRSRKQWRNWLAKNHSKYQGIWLVVAKKDSGLPSLTMSEAVEEALCFGWIDSTAWKVDENYFKVSFSPRRATSKWSKINKARITKLMDLKLMRAPGLKAIDVSKKNGNWEALDKIEELEIPPDLKKALAKNKKAKLNFEKFPPSSKKMILYWIVSAKQTETRERRIRETVEKAALNLRVNQIPKVKA